MVRGSNSSPTEVLIPIVSIANRLGYVEEVLWRRLTPGEAVEDWDGTWAVPWSRAKQLFDRLSTENAEHERTERQRREAQMDAEREARMWPVRAFELAEQQAKQRSAGWRWWRRHRHPGPAPPDPAWADLPSLSDDDE
jgi:hypothetical protein